ncbi:hypothetical protein MJT46_015368 [Ovis ammon polii x Ovis aries]|nr:hypothetical protein MJT46_015368 [Ovis ammon polii x Ovis aries]
MALLRCDQVYPSAQQQTHCHPYCITLSNQQRRCSRPPRVRKFAARWRHRALGAELRESSARRTLSQDLLAPPGKILSFAEASMPQLAFTTSLDIYHNVICKMHSEKETCLGFGLRVSYPVKSFQNQDRVWSNLKINSARLPTGNTFEGLGARRRPAAPRAPRSSEGSVLQTALEQARLHRDRVLSEDPVALRVSTPLSVPTVKVLC